MRHSKPGFFRYAHKGNRVRLCHFPHQTSARVCLAPGLWRELAHAEPPCISAFWYEHPLSPLHTVWRAGEEITQGRRNLLISAPCTYMPAWSTRTNDRRAFRLLGRVEEWAQEVVFLNPSLCFMNKEAALSSDCFLASSSHPNCPPCLFDCTLLLSGFFRDKAQQNEACWLGFLSPGLRAHSAARF